MKCVYSETEIIFMQAPFSKDSVDIKISRLLSIKIMKFSKDTFATTKAIVIIILALEEDWTHPAESSIHR